MYMQPVFPFWFCYADALEEWGTRKASRSGRGLFFLKVLETDTAKVCKAAISLCTSAVYYAHDLMHFTEAGCKYSANKAYVKHYLLARFCSHRV